MAAQPKTPSIKHHGFCYEHLASFLRETLSDLEMHKQVHGLEWQVICEVCGVKDGQARIASWLVTINPEGAS